MREPYAVYMQGGLSKEYVQLAVIAAAKAVLAVNKG
jgi:cystathionine beta-lyase family protein involved in aluminum resistance